MHHRSNYQCRYRRAGCQVAAHRPIGDFKLAGDFRLAESRPVDEFAKFTGFHTLNLGQIVLGHNFLAGTPTGDVEKTVCSIGSKIAADIGIKAFEYSSVYELHITAEAGYLSGRKLP